MTVTGVDDSVADGHQAYTIVTAPATSTDPRLQRPQPATTSRWSTPTTRSTRCARTLGLTGTTFTGAGVGVAVIDSGVASNADLQGRVVAFKDFTGEFTGTTAYDKYGHGTHVAGLIGGNGSLSTSAQYGGVAPKANLIALARARQPGRRA